MYELIQIFSTFFKIGILTFGGGYAMLPLLQKDIVRRLGWATDEEIIDYYAISQSLPGIIAINISMLVGYGRRKTSGLIAAALGMASPSLIIILIIAVFIKNFQHLELVEHAFNGIRVAVSALIVSSAVSMWKSGVKDAAGGLIFALSLLVFTFVDISPVLPVVLGAAAGIVIKSGREIAK
ncbi:MAG: chromate transporter [Synergistaceae bacterium]|nr:chromate transporter [Synergistaceae bacterium]